MSAGLTYITNLTVGTDKMIDHEGFQILGTLSLADKKDDILVGEKAICMSVFLQKFSHISVTFCWVNLENFPI